MSSLNDFRAREEQLRRLDEQLNDKKNEVVRRAEELVRQQSDRLARLQLESTAPPPSSYGAGGLVHHPYGEQEQGFLEETTGYRGRYEAPHAAAPAEHAERSRPASGTAVRSHARPVSAASQDGRRRMSGIPAPHGGASHAASAAAAAAGAPARTASASAARLTPSGLSSASSTAPSSRPQSRTQRLSAAPSAASAAAAAAAADHYGHNEGGEDDGGGGGGGSVAAADGADGDDGDALGFGAEGVDGGIASTAGMGTAATLRFQKARLQALSSSVATLTSTLGARDKELAELKSLLKSGNDSREKLLRAKEAAEKQSQALQRQLDESAARAHTSDSKVASMERELAQAHKRRAEMDAEAKTRDAKLNRALQELERTKEMLARAKSSGGGGAGAGASDESAKELSALRGANKKLMQQRAELLAGFRKQAKLIDLLRRQKLHVEMAKMLQFTEEEFAKTLEMGEI